MVKVHKNNELASKLMAVFVVSGGLGFYGGTLWQDNQSYSDAYNAGYQSFQDELDACRSAKNNAGVALADYILGENDVTEAALDEAENLAARLCVKPDFEI